MLNDSGRSMIEMILVLALIGILSIGGITSYQNAQDQNDANKINELVSIASLNGLTKIKNYDNERIWTVIGKKQEDYGCIRSLAVRSNGQVDIQFDGCRKVKGILLDQWGNHAYGSEESYTYTPPREDE